MKLNARSILEHLTGRQIELLRAYERMLRERAVPLGFVAKSDAERLWDRHILDSLRGLSCLRPSDHQVVDVGSGAGLPGIPLAIARPEAQFVLAEPKQRRAALLESMVASLGLTNASVAARGAEELDLTVHLGLARAVADPVESWRIASPLLRERGRLAYWAGRSWREKEIARLARAGANAEIGLEPEFQWQGPLVIMRSFSTGIPEGP